MLVHDLYDLLPYSYIFLIAKTGFTITIKALKIFNYVQCKGNIAIKYSKWLQFAFSVGHYLTHYFFRTLSLYRRGWTIHFC